MCDNCAEARRAAEQVASDATRAEKSREFYRRQGECRERERIIKLLEQMDIEIHYTTWFDAQGNVMNRLASPETLDREKVFALIKGENK
ncbi:MAG: hypothetical protein EBU12_10700 [Microbacteriaceae bacterium]|nr:hypothetical protein [Microbacteriaceae bacterium]